MAPHSSTLAWEILWTEVSSRLQSMGLQRVGHDWVTSLSLFTSCTGEGNGNPLQNSCLENPRDGEAWWAAIYAVAQNQTWLKRFSSSSSNEKNIKVFNKDMLQQGQDLGEVNEVGHKSIASAPVFTGNFNFLRSTFYLNTGDCTLKRSQLKDVGWCVFICRNFIVHGLLIISVNFPSLTFVWVFYHHYSLYFLPQFP